MCDVAHATYGLTMSDGLWRASCACGWRSVPSPDLAEQTDELDQHLRVVVIAEQRPGRGTRAATEAVVQVVDHSMVLATVLVAALLPLVARTRRA